MAVMRTQRDVHQQRILEILSDSPSGEMSAGDVLDALERHYGHLLNDTDRLQHSDGSEYWQTRARRTSGYMVDDGLLTRPARGVWKLTDAGRAAARTANTAAGRGGTTEQMVRGGVAPAASLIAQSVGAVSLGLQVDDVVTRQQLNTAYGGGIQGGMLTPAGGRYIFLFSDPVPGGQYGYTWDGWADRTLGTFFYTGEGQVGDQEFIRRNRTLLNSTADSREVHLFVAHGYSGEGEERTHSYMGQFTVDPNDPWRREDALDKHGAMRSVIVFRLNRTEESPAPHSHTDSLAPNVARNSGAEMIGPEKSSTTEFNRAPSEETLAVRRERSLEDALHKYLHASGGQPNRLRISIAGQTNPLYTDTWDGARRELYEAKGSVSRNDVRLAIGQLLDYRRHIAPPPARCTVLLPSDPGEDLTNLIHSSGMDLLYQDGNTFIRRSPAPGRAPGLASEQKKEFARIRTASFPSPPGPNPNRQTEGRASTNPATTAINVRLPANGTRRGQNRD